MKKVLNSNNSDNQGSSLKKKVLNSNNSENQGSSSQKKVLIIEDEKILAEMYKDKFIQAKLEVFSAIESREGLKLAKEEKPDLILLDILLPRENGITFLTWLRAEEDLEINSIPVIVFSNFDDPETKKEAIRLGVIDYLIKTNYTPQEIIEKVQDYFNKNE